MKKFLFVLISCILIASGHCYVEAKEQTIRVGFPIQKGLTEKTEDGRYTGYTVDYLNEIAKYTGWNIEYVEAAGNLNTQIATLIQWLQEGKIDMLGTMIYNEAATDRYDYSGYSYGTAYTTLCVKEDDYRWLENDYSNWNEIRIGYTSSLEKRFELLDSYAKMNNFTYKKVPYDTELDIYKALDRGEIDAVISVDIGMPTGIKSIARFSATPYYFALTKGKSKILNELNKTMANLNSSNPYLLSSLYEKYFSKKNETFILTEEQKEYIKKRKKIRVLLGDKSVPLQYFDRDGNPKGVIVDFFEFLSSTTGLKFEFVAPTKEDNRKTLIKDKKVDLVGGFARYSDLLNSVSYRLTLPYLEMNMMLAVRKGVDQKDLKDKKLGIVFSEAEYFNHSNQVEKDKITIYRDPEKCLEALNRGEVDYAYINEYCFSYFMKSENKYSLVQSVPYIETFKTDYSIAILDQDDETLGTILNTAIHFMDEDTLHKIIYKNSSISSSFTFYDFLEEYKIQILMIVIVILLVVLLIGIQFYRLKVRGYTLLQLESRKFDQLARLSGDTVFEYNYNTEQFHVFIQYGKQQLCLEKSTVLKEYLEQRKNISAEDAKIIQDHMTTYSLILEIGDLHGKEPYAIGKMTDISKSILEKEQLIEKAKRDGMTGLYNASTAKQMAIDFWKENTNDIVAIIDIDYFKQINDSYGHAIGDAVITSIANILTEVFGSFGFVGRIGGDEFMLYVNQIPQEADLKLLFQTFQEKVKKELKNLCKVTLSIGVADSKNCSFFPEQFDKADKALYEAKRKGRNSICYYINGIYELQKDSMS